MARSSITPSGRECFFNENEIIVSKTDPSGKILYANDVFLRIAGYTEAEVIGQPHSMIRHPEMPRCVFKLLWDTISSGHEIFAYVVNMAKNGDHYWVFAHVTPTFNENGDVIGYHSSRRNPRREVLPTIEKLYALLRSEEASGTDRRRSLEASTALLRNFLAEKKTSYGELMFQL